MIEAFLEPTRTEEALRLRRELGDAAVFLAGGTEVNAGYAFTAPTSIISLGKLDLGRIEKKGKAFSLPATATIQEILDTPSIPNELAAACRNIVNRNVRNMATIGGHIASNKSCADVIPVLAALEASVEAWLVSDGSEKTLPLMDFIAGELPPVLIRRVIVPEGRGRRLAICNYTRSSNDMSILTSAVSVDEKDEVLERPIVAVGGVAAHVVRLFALEQALDGKALPAQEKIQEQVGANVSPISDLRGSAGFKRHLAGVLVARALHRAMNADVGGSI